jgi:transcriptional regulator CtsR
MLTYVSGDNTYRMNGGVPGNKQTILLNAITIGAHYGTKYQEIYQADLEDPTMSSVIDTANTLLTVTPPIPGAPSNLSGTSDGPYIADITWRDNANNELGYRIESKIGATGTYGVQTTVGPNTTATTLTNLIEGTQYYFRVQGVNAGGRSTYSNEISATTVLRKPTSASATAVSSRQINLTWVDNSTSETGYKIERKKTSTGTYTQIAQVGANVQSYHDTNGLQSNTKYYYRIRGTNAATNSDYSNQPSAVTFR